MARLLRFLMVGVANTAIGLFSIFAAMRFLDMSEAAANALGYAIGTTFSFTANRAWTFGDGAPATQSLPRWLAVAGCAYLSNLVVVLAACRLLGVDPYLSQFLGVPVYSGVGFLGARYYAFREPATLLQET
jgi:putative flippase GtrA